VDQPVQRQPGVGVVLLAGDEPGGRVDHDQGDGEALDEDQQLLGGLVSVELPREAWNWK
jgi:hypothetical protein